jgi:hypothetical protein
MTEGVSMQGVSYDVLARRRLGRRLRKMRDAAEMPPVEAALRANLTESVLERLERGTSRQHRRWRGRSCDCTGKTTGPWSPGYWTW